MFTIFVPQSSYNDIKNISPFTLPFAHSEQTGLPLCLGIYFYMNNQEEIWKDVVGFEGVFEISNHCRIRSLDRLVRYTIKGKPCIMRKKGKIYENRTHCILSTPKKRISICIEDEMKKVFDESSCVNNRENIPDLQDEIWKPIKGFEGLYSASNLGRIKSLSRVYSRIKNGKKQEIRLVGRVIRYALSWQGYCGTVLRKNNIHKSVRVHRVIAETFIPKIENKTHINHKNGVKEDNRVENLEWCNQQENNRHAWDLGLAKMSKEKIEAIRISVSKKVLDYSTGIEYPSMRRAAAELYPNISYEMVIYYMKKKSSKVTLQYI